MLRKISSFAILLSVVLLSPLGVQAESGSWDSERLNLETSIQKRVEESLSKLLPAGQFVLVVRVEPWTPQADPAPEEDLGAGYYLPGVPEKNRFDNQVNTKELVSALKPESLLFKRFIRQISVTLVIDQDIPEQTVDKVRELTRQMAGLDPQRGDTLSVQRTAFQKAPTPFIDNSSIFKLQNSLRSYWMVISLSLILFCVAVFFLFMFGPFRGFLNRFVQVLTALKPNESNESRYPRFGLGDMPYMPFMPPGYGMMPNGTQGPGGNPGSSLSGMLQVENPNKVLLPFSFIREDNLGSLAILLARETPEKAAVVLGYLPNEWISRILTRIDPEQQNEIAKHLATTRQLLPEQVEDIEQELRRRLDYLVGGPDRLVAIYESLEPDAQKRMLDNLKESQPEVAGEIRQRLMLFEDLDKLDAGILKSLLREVDLQTLVVSLHGVSDTFLKKILESVSQGKAEIIREELHLNKKIPERTLSEAQRKVAMIARRLQKEGRINMPQVESSGAPSTRYGSSLRDVLKLPPGMKARSDSNPEVPSTNVPISVEQDIEARIKKFMNRASSDKERYPQNPDDTATEE